MFKSKTKNKKKRLRQLGIFLFVFFILVVFVVSLLYFPCRKDFRDPVAVVVEKGEKLITISEKFKNEKAICWKWPFFFSAVVMRLKGKVPQAGTYLFPPGTTIVDAVRMLFKGETLKYKITVLEGWSLKEIGEELERQGIVSKEEFYKASGAPVCGGGWECPPLKGIAEKFDFLQEKPENLNLEGYLFPDTYEIAANETAETIVKKMLVNFEKQVVKSEISKEAQRKGKSLFQVLKMASLLEKEASNYEERRLIAGILWKRLENDWPLQVDASLSYAVGRGSRRLTKKDLNSDSPYNTYKWRGLPLTPICNPSLKSIKAAVYYRESPYWFYLAEPGGKTVFSRTLREHNYNKRKFLD